MPGRSFRAVGGACFALLGCGTTGAPPPPEPAFPGTLFVERAEGRPVERPIGLDASNREFRVPVDLSAYYPDDDPENFPNLIHDFDASLDGEFLYAAVRSKILRFELPGGGAMREVADLIHPVGNVRVSPDGRRLVAILAIMSDVMILNADGTGVRLVVRPDPLVRLTPPVWVGNDRLLLVESRATPDGIRYRVVDIQGPNWEPTDYLPLDGAIPPGSDVAGIWAAPSGDRLLLTTCQSMPSWQCRIAEYPIDGFHGTHRLTVTDENTGGSWVLSPDGAFVATRRGDQIVVFDLGTGQQVGPLLGKPGRAESPKVWVTAEYQ